MADYKTNIRELLTRFQTGELNDEEAEQLRHLLSDEAAIASVSELIDQDFQNGAIKGLSNAATLEEMYAKILAERPRQVIAHRIHFLRKWGWAAASIILVFGIGAYLWSTNKKITHLPAVAQANVDIPPGKEGAILTLADGSQVVLDSLGNGVIALQNGAQAVVKNGMLTYNLTGKIAGEAVYNTMITPKGRQFSLLLPDGTRVWLNAASSLRYPTVFTGRQRQVYLTGEAYFEIAKNARMPFQVKVNEKATVEVLGTHFNMNAYENEASINTTLLEGSVKVNGTSIKPGQQAQVAVIASPDHQLSSSQQIKVINNADIDKVMAWKNGVFNFDGANLEDVMRQLERWYNIEVVFQKGIPDTPLYGKVRRDVSLISLLKGLEDILDIHFRIEGRRLIVLP